MSIGIGLGAIRASASTVSGLGYYNAVMSLPVLYYYRFEDPVRNLDSGPVHFAGLGDGYPPGASVPGLYPGGGLAYSFSGISYWDVAVFQVPTTESATVVAGVSLVNATGDRNIVASIVGAISVAHTIMFGYESDGKPIVQCYGSSGIRVIGPTSLAGAGVRHMAWRWNKVTFDVDIFVNGVNIAHGNNGGGLNSGSGNYQVCAGNGRLFKGTLDELAWFPTALSDAQITTLYNAWLAGA